MNSFGRRFRVSVFGESHGPAIGVVIDGVPAGMRLSSEDFSADIDRRRSGARGTTPRKEEDIPEILSGIHDGHTTGAPMSIIFRNGNTRSSDYELFRAVPRPGHADHVADVRWHGYNDARGGGHFSGRLTLPVVAAGAVAKKLLSGCGGISIRASLVEVGGISCRQEDGTLPQEVADAIDDAIREGDSLGGIVECIVCGLPAGIGEPFWDSLESMISHAVFSIPGVRGVEFGDGFAAASMKGSEHNDPLGCDGIPLKNGAGGINGGLSSGAPIVFRVAFKPTSSIRKTQLTADVKTGVMTGLSVPGRHDACFALRAPVVVEAMAAVVLADMVPQYL